MNTNVCYVKSIYSLMNINDQIIFPSSLFNFPYESLCFFIHLSLNARLSKIQYKYFIYSVFSLKGPLLLQSGSITDTLLYLDSTVFIDAESRTSQTDKIIRTNNIEHRKAFQKGNVHMVSSFSFNVCGMWYVLQFFQALEVKTLKKFWKWRRKNIYLNETYETIMIIDKICDYLFLYTYIINSHSCANFEQLLFISKGCLKNLKIHICIAYTEF